MLPMTSAAWWTRLRAVAPQSGADERANFRTFSLLPTAALNPRCAMSQRPFANNYDIITAIDIMNVYGKWTVKGGPAQRGPNRTCKQIITVTRTND
jgi:hypothetical protein